MHMLFASILSWWYGLGWAQLTQKVRGRLAQVLDFFSVGLLAGSLFAPYRQISSGDTKVGFGDQILSRVVGAVIRIMLIFAGLVSAGLAGALGLLLILAWPILPALPFVGIFMLQVGVG